MANNNSTFNTWIRGIATLSLISYLGWLGLSVYHISEVIGPLPKDIRRLEDTVFLMKERQDQRTQKFDEIYRRLEQLERSMKGPR